jgi:hypothetical protein
MAGRVAVWSRETEVRTHDAGLQSGKTTEGGLIG